MKFPRRSVAKSQSQSAEQRKYIFSYDRFGDFAYQMSFYRVVLAGEVPELETYANLFL